MEPFGMAFQHAGYKAGYKGEMVLRKFYHAKPIWLDMKSAGIFTIS
jgi:hypothetical protein